MLISKKWIVCFQTPFNCIKYQSFDGSIKYPSYYDFLSLMMKNHIKNPREFKKELDTFKTILIDLESGEWELVKLNKNINVSFEELVKLNTEKIKINKKESMVEKGKRFITAWK